MNFILEMRKKKLLKLSKEIEEYKVELEPFKNLDDYRELSATSQRNIRKTETTIREKKLKKIKKTKEEYYQNRVYNQNKKKEFESVIAHGVEEESNIQDNNIQFTGHIFQGGRPATNQIWKKNYGPFKEGDNRRMGPNYRAPKTNWGQSRPSYPQSYHQESPNWGYNNRSYQPWRNYSNQQYPPRRPHFVRRENERWRPQYREEEPRENWPFDYQRDRLPPANPQPMMNKNQQNFPHQRLGDRHLRPEEYHNGTPVKRKLGEGERNVQSHNPKNTKEFQRVGGFSI